MDCEINKSLSYAKNQSELVSLDVYMECIISETTSTDVVKSDKQSNLSSLISENEVRPQGFVNKKRNKLTCAKLYDNMISANYTLNNGELNQEKITQQSYSFNKK